MTVQAQKYVEDLYHVVFVHGSVSYEAGTGIVRELCQCSGAETRDAWKESEK